MISNAARSAQRIIEQLERDARTKAPQVRERMRFVDFLPYAWPIVEPQPLVLERHMVEVCSALERVTWHMRPHLRPLDVEHAPLPSLQEVLVNVPPGTSKSLLVCVLWHAWCWTLDPTIKFIYASHDANLSLRDAERAKTILTSTWYISKWGDLRRVGQTWTKRYFVNRFGGSRLSTSIGGAVIGNHADARVIDDPIKPQALLGDKDSVHDVLRKPIEFLTRTLSTRMTDPKRSVTVIVMQRLHQGDLAGHVLDTMSRASPEKRAKFLHVRYPMRFHASYVPESWEAPDWRTVEGELLAPKRYDASAVEQLESDLGSLQNRSAQLDQEPIAEGGNLFRRSDFKRGLPTAEQIRKGRLIQSWDARFTDDQEKGDFVAGQVWLATGADRYMLARVNVRLSFLQSCNAMVQLSNEWPLARIKLLENKANGPAIFNVLQSRVGGIKLVEPQGGKMARANATTSIVEGGNVWIMPGAEGDAFLDQVCAFPKARHDDEVDAFTQAMIYFDDRKKTRYSDFLSSLVR